MRTSLKFGYGQKSKIYAYMKLYVFLYGTTIDVMLTAENQSYMRIKKRTVKFPELIKAPSV